MCACVCVPCVHTCAHTNDVPENVSVGSFHADWDFGSLRKLQGAGACTGDDYPVKADGAWTVTYSPEAPSLQTQGMQALQSSTQQVVHLGAPTLSSHVADALDLESVVPTNPADPHSPLW